MYNNYMNTTLLLLSLIGCNPLQPSAPRSYITVERLAEVAQPGDIVIQAEYSLQSWAIREATNSNITHVGVVIDSDSDGDLEIIEAVGPVKITSFESFAKRGPIGLRRLKSVEAHRENIDKNLAAATEVYLGLPYDVKFKWDDEKIYCSELVWKSFDDIGVNVSDPSKFSDLKLDGPLARQLINSRLSSTADIDYNETIVTPADLERSPHLTVIE